MIRLIANPQAVSALLGFLDGTPEQIAYLQGIVQTHGANPGDYYTNNPDPGLSYDQLSALPAFQSQDWSRMIHPYVTAQLLVDLCEKANVPLPDNLHVAVDGEWQPLSYVQPTYARPAAPAPLAAPEPDPAPDPYPEPQPIATTPPAPTTLQLQPDPEVLDGEFLAAPPPAQDNYLAGMVQREVLGAVVTMPAETAKQVDAARAARTEAATPAPVEGVAMPVQTQPDAPVQTLAGAGEFGLPQPFMHASKGTSVLDKDPGGQVPSGTSPRQIRDLMAMMPRLFAAPAGDVVGKGAGSVQRHRLYTAALLLVHTALSSVPDKNCPVSYLLWHLEHLRYNASQTPGGTTMLKYEQWLFRDGKDGE